MCARKPTLRKCAQTDTKKNYAATAFEPGGKPPKIKMQGFDRRDKSTTTIGTTKAVLESLAEGRSPAEALQAVDVHFRSIRRNPNIADFELTVELTDKSRKTGGLAGNLAKDMEKHGHKIQTGSRVPFVRIAREGAKAADSVRHVASATSKEIDRAYYEKLSRDALGRVGSLLSVHAKALEHVGTRQRVLMI